jgi:membrane protease YdiL (CAAX protease family)
MRKLTVSMPRTEWIPGLIYIAVQLLVLPFILAFGNMLLGNPLTEAQLNFVFFAADFICVTVICHRFLWHNAKQAFTAPFRCLRYAGAGLILYWLGSYVVSLLIVAVYPDFANVNDESIAQLTQNNYTLMSIGTVFLVPVLEETLYRGLVFGKLYNRRPFSAYVISTFVFSALHVVGYIGLYEPLHLCLCFLQYIPAGLCLAWSYVRADSIWAPILIHMTINQIGILSMR